MRVIVAVLASLIVFTNTYVIAQSPSLADILSDKNCPAACYWGIMPGITSQRELKAILSRNHVIFSEGAIDPSNALISYAFAPIENSPYFRAGDASIYVDVTANTVDLITILLTDVRVADMTSGFGAPDVISDTGWLIYVDKGLMFLARRDAPNNINLVYLTPAGREAVRLAYYLEGATCTNAVELCSISTATPTANPADQAVTLKSVFNPPGCSVSCWLGIQPGITTQTEVQAILADLGVEYTINASSFPPVGTGEENGIYDFTPPPDTPFFNFQAQASIQFWEGIATLIRIPVNIPSSRVFSEYGAPYRVILLDKASLRMVYPDRLVSFVTGVDLIEKHVTLMEIGTERTLNDYFLSYDDTFSIPVDDCQTLLSNCFWATATPTLQP